MVTDKTAPEGSKSLYFNSTGNGTEQWHSFTVKVKKDTDYVFAAWVKGSILSASNAGHASIGVVDPTTGKFMIYPDYRTRTSRGNRQIYPTAWDGQWHLRSVAFNSGNLTEVTIALCGESTQMWVDGLALFKNGDGVKYNDPRATGSLRVNFYADKYTVADNKCLNGNPSISSTDYWKNGSGWQNGFLSVVSGGKSGKALQYTATADAAGVYYIQWVDVTPNTEYVFSVDAKILKSGNGRLTLLSDRLLKPEEEAFLLFDQDTYGDGWFAFYITFNSLCFDRVGIAVCDQGGKALMDNIKLYKVSDGKLVEENDGHNTAGGQTGRPDSGNSGDGGNTPSDTPVGGGEDTPSDSDSPVTDAPADGGDTPADTDKGNTTKPKDEEKASFTWTGPMILLVSFGGTAALIGVAVGVYFLVRAMVKKKKAK